MFGRSALISAGIMLAVGTQEPRSQEEALAVLAKIDGKAKFDPAHPKRVIAVDL